MIDIWVLIIKKEKDESLMVFLAIIMGFEIKFIVGVIFHYLVLLNCVYC